MPSDTLTVSEAAQLLDVSVQQVRRLIAAGRLAATRHGRAHVIRRADLKRIAYGKPGRPPGKAE